MTKIFITQTFKQLRGVRFENRTGDPADTILIVRNSVKQNLLNRNSFDAQWLIRRLDGDQGDEGG